MSLSEPPPLDDSSRLREYLGVLRVRKWTVIITTLLAVLAAAFYIQRTTPTYTATAKVQVRNPLAFLPGNSNQTSAPNMQPGQPRWPSPNVAAGAQQFFAFSPGKRVPVPSPSPPPAPSPSASPSAKPS